MDTKNNRIQTKRHNKFIVMMIIVLAISIGFIVWFCLNNELLVIKIIVFVMCTIFAALSLVMILHLTFDYLLFDEDNHVISHKIFSKKRIKVKDLDYYSSKDGLITLYYQNKMFGSFDSGDPNYTSIMNILNRNKIKSKQGDK